MKIVENTPERLIVEKVLFFERLAGPFWIASGAFVLWGFTYELLLHGGDEVFHPVSALSLLIPIAMLGIGGALIRNSGPVRLVLDRRNGTATITQTRLSGSRQHDLPLDKIDALHMRFAGFGTMTHWEFLLRDGTRFWIGKTMQKRWRPLQQQGQDPEVWDVFTAATAVKRWLADARAATTDAPASGAATK